MCLKRLSDVQLAALVEEAVVDCYDEWEQVTGLFNMIDENLQLPFETIILGMPVQVVSIDIRDHDNSIIAVCKRGRERQAISLLDLPFRLLLRKGRSGSRRIGIGRAGVESPMSEYQSYEFQAVYRPRAVRVSS